MSGAGTLPLRTEGAGSHPRSHRHERTNVGMLVLESPIDHGDDRHREGSRRGLLRGRREREGAFTLGKTVIDRELAPPPDLKPPFLSDR